MMLSKRVKSICLCICLLWNTTSVNHTAYASSPTEPASIFVVNTALDYEDCSPGDGVCNPGTWDAEHTLCTPVPNVCTLRAAIEEANASTGTDEIRFSFVAQPIRPAIPLPYITAPLVIDGINAGYGGSVQLDGTAAPAGTNGLFVWASNCTIRGMTITGFQGAGSYDGFGIALDGDNNVVEGNYLGTNASGDTGLGNGNGGIVLAGGAENNRIGGPTPTQRNVISGNDGHGIQIGEPLSGGASNNRVIGNYIGVAPDGQAALPNGLTGVSVFYAGSIANQIGGTAADEGNVVSGNGQHGIGVSLGSSGNLIQGNFVGTNASGTLALPNAGAGVILHQASNNTVGGTVAGAGNLISGNWLSGVEISMPPAIATQDTTTILEPRALGRHREDGIPALIVMAPALSNIVQGNIIGLDGGGTFAIPNWGSGVMIHNASLNTIGGTVSGARNIIAGNYGNGITIQTAGGESATGNVVQGNFIGTDQTGTVTNPDGISWNGDELGNLSYGIVIADAAANTIGGTASGAGNLIAGHYEYGVYLFGNQTAGNQVLGNAIGTNVAGTLALGNRRGGILLSETADNKLGGLIANNGGPGIAAMAMPVNGDLTLEAVTVRDNQGDGIGYVAGTWGDSDNPGVELSGSGNIIVDNVGHGIFSSPGHVTITGSNTVIERNGGWGIHATGEVNVGTGAMNALRNNRQGGVMGTEGVWLPPGFVVEDNGGPGIVALGDNGLILENITVQRNKGDGIGFAAMSWGGSGPNPGIWIQGANNRILDNGGHGIHAQIGDVTITGTGTLVEDNGGWGIRALGEVEISQGAMSAVRNNAQGGVIGVEGVGLPTGFVVEGNGGPGIVAGGIGSLILEDVIIRNNLGDGVGFFAATWSNDGWNPGVWIQGSGTEITDNGGDGIHAQPGNVTIAGTGTAIDDNDGWGIHALGAVEIRDGAMSGLRNNGQGGVLGNDGVDVPPQFVIEDNGGPGIVSGGGDGLYLENVTIRNNQGDGIGTVQTRLVLTGETNVIEQNAGHGIYARLGDVWLTGATIRSNGGWGIQAEGSDSFRADHTQIAVNTVGGVLMAGDSFNGSDVKVAGNLGPGIATTLASVNLQSVQVCDNQGPGLTMIDGDLTAQGIDVCRNTAGGIALSGMTGSAASLVRSLLLSNGADGLRYEVGTAGLNASESSILGNTGYGVRNLETGVVLQAQYNWWGDASGPGGVGPGTGDEVSTDVDYGNWQQWGIPLVVFPEEAHIVAARGVTQTTQVRLRHWDYPTDTLTVTLTDMFGWVWNAGWVTVTLQDDGASAVNVAQALYPDQHAFAVGGAVEVGIHVPAGAILGTTDQVTVVAVSHADPSVIFTGTLEIQAGVIADLQVSQDDGITQVLTGRPVTYTVVVANNGPDHAMGVVLTDTLPSGATVSSVQTGQGGCVPQAGEIVCTLGAMDVGAAVTVTMVATPTVAGELVNRVRVGALEDDPDPDNNRDTAYATVLTPVALASATLEGPSIWVRDHFATFVASGAPFTASLPVTFTWQTSGQWWHTEVHVVYAVTDTLSLMWPVTGTQTVTMTAVNLYGSAITETRAVTIVVNQAPVANAGPDRSVTFGDVVQLDGSGSLDTAESLPLRYQWTQAGGTPVVLSSAVISRPTFTAPTTRTVLTFTLQVTDVHGLASANEDAVVIAVEAEKLHVYLPLVMRNYTPMPVHTLQYSTYFGGVDEDTIKDSAVGPGGYLYLTGETYSSDLGPGSSGRSFSRVFVAKLTPDGKTLVYYRQFGGTADSGGEALAVDTAGNVYVTGYTRSYTFPRTTGAFDSSFNGGEEAEVDAFVTKLDANGTIVYSSYLGGSGYDIPGAGRSGGLDWGRSIAVLGEYVYIVGDTESSDFPTTAGAYDRAYADVDWGLNADLFIVKMRLGGQGSADLVYGTFLGGGASFEFAADLAVDSTGRLVITGNVEDRYSIGEFPLTPGAVDTIHPSGFWVPKAFLIKFNPAGGGQSDLVYSTYLGGTGIDKGHGVALGSDGTVYVTGQTYSADFPTTVGAFDRTCGTDGTCYNGGMSDAFIARIHPNPAASGPANFLYSTYLGGGGGENFYGRGSIALVAPGEVYVAGLTGSLDFPTTPDAYDRDRNATNTDLFLARLRLAGQAEDDLVYGTYIGGDDFDESYGVVWSGSAVTLIGNTESGDFPVTLDALYSTHNGGTTDGFVFQFGVVMK